MERFSYTKSERQADAAKLVLKEDDLSEFKYKFFVSPVEYDMRGLEFKVNQDIARFAYKLAVWKEPEVIDKPDYPPRTFEEKVFHLFIGNVTECLTYLYLKGMRLKVDYYDLVRDTNVFGGCDDYDLILYRGSEGRTISLKSNPTFYDDMMCRFNVTDMILKGTPKSADNYYLQWQVFKNAYCRKFDTQDYKDLYSRIEGNMLDMRFVFIGGLVNWNKLRYEQLKDTYDSNGYGITFKKQYDVPNFLMELYNSLK